MRSRRNSRASTLSGTRITRRVRHELGRSPSITDAIYRAGFNSNSRFYAAAPAVLGMTPTTFRRGGAGLVIHRAFGRSSLGLVLVAATERGVCAIMLGDDRAALTRDLAARFPKAQIVAGAGQTASIKTM